MDYYFEMVQKLKFAVYDIDNETSALGDDDFLGDMECNLGQVCNILLTHFTELGPLHMSLVNRAGSVSEISPRDSFLCQNIDVFI